MNERPAPPIPERPTLSKLRAAVQACRACDLYEGATQAVMGEVDKHFRYKTRGKRRIHQTPDRWQVNACLPWLRAEIAVVRPAALVLLGAVASQALLDRQVRIGRDRGRPIDSELAELVMITTHPSAILRARDDAERKAAMEQFVPDLASVARWLRSH